MGKVFLFVSINTQTHKEPGKRSQYSKWLRAVRPRGQSSSPERGEIFLLSMSSGPVLGPTHFPIQCVPGTLFPAAKRPWHEGEHSPPTSAEVNNTWIYISTPPYAFMA
jgi:hypothetical protein